MEKNSAKTTLSVFYKPLTGSILTAASGVAFLALGITMPLVGRAGYATPHYRANFMTFLGILLLSLVLAVLALLSKTGRRKLDGSPPPYWSWTLCVINLLILVCLLSGWLHL